MLSGILLFKQCSQILFLIYYYKSQIRKKDQPFESLVLNNQIRKKLFAEILKLDQKQQIYTLYTYKNVLVLIEIILPKFFFEWLVL